MSNYVKTKGIVLHEMPIGEFDKRVILLTKEAGKVTAFAKGARRIKSKLLAGTGVFSYGEYLLYKGKTSYNISQVEIIKSFHNIREDIERLSYGLYILEFGEYVSDENNPNNLLMKLILKTLQVLEKGNLENELIIRIFELKALSFIGLTPEVYHCVNCNKDAPLIYFSTLQGGIICSQCYRAGQHIFKVSSSTLYTIRYILSSSLNDLYSFKVNSQILRELKGIMKSFIAYHINKKFKALEFLNIQI